MAVKEVYNVAEDKMKKSINAMLTAFAAIRAGRANPAVLDRITVSYYGVETPINQVAAIAVSEARVLTIQPWDASLNKLIEKAIQASDLGINPQSDGRTIRLTFPPLTEERRKALAKDIAKLAEDAKVAIRSIRRDAIEKLKAQKKANEITEDDQKEAEKNIQKLTDKYCDEVDKLSEEKKKEIMSI